MNNRHQMIVFHERRQLDRPWGDLGMSATWTLGTSDFILQNIRRRRVRCWFDSDHRYEATLRSRSILRC